VGAVLLGAVGASGWPRIHQRGQIEERRQSAGRASLVHRAFLVAEAVAAVAQDAPVDVVAKDKMDMTRALGRKTWLDGRLGIERPDGGAAAEEVECFQLVVAAMCLREV
jgi:hypothetical protein